MVADGSKGNPLIFFIVCGFTLSRIARDCFPNYPQNFLSTWRE